MMETTNRHPDLQLSHLDHLWFQVAGTLCNLTCCHCFISCSPHNDNFGFLTLDEVRARLHESVALGVKEYYFTGGEPFLNRDLVPILIETLKYGPATVLTNGTVLKDAWLEALAAAERQSRYSLELRVSIDGFSPESNDPIRGEGTFARAMEGVRKLVEYGFLPIITAARTWSEADEHEVVGRFIAMLRAAGYARPRLKILPTLQLGAEEERTSGYRESERISPEMMDGFDAAQLICEHSRVVTDRGVYVCPILIDSEDARLAAELSESLGSYELSHGACFTCYQYGAICSNPSSSAGDGRWRTA
jgi:molybdenum cofactor biosynthesis enzyme MoaA